MKILYLQATIITILLVLNNNYFTLNKSGEPPIAHAIAVFLKINNILY